MPDNCRRWTNGIPSAAVIRECASRATAPGITRASRFARTRERSALSRSRIARDGTWYHEGRPIRRPAMVRLFSTVLRREPDGRHLLVTPVEKLEIDVEATAFRAVEMESEGVGKQRRVAFRLDSGDAVILGPDHPLRLVPDAHGPSPRILVRHGLEAEPARPVYYELAELAIAEGNDPPGLWSDGAFFALDPE